jgi:hypothetical protein
MHRNQESYRSSRRELLTGSALSLLSLSLLSLGLCSGCAEPLPKEHVAAVSKMQGLGAKVQFEDGGLRLNMADTRIEDADLTHLQNIQNLKTIDLRATHITDKGLATIQSLKSLKAILLTGSAVTPDGVDALQKARPDLTITR